MTIKTQNGKVVTKDGKVSCECCDEPGECCMYPAQALGDGDYSYDDLPDVIEVLIDNVFTPFSRSGIYFYSDSAIGLIPAGDYRVRLLDNGVPWIPGTEDFQYNWRLEVWNGISWGTRDDIDDWQCLIQGLPEDFERTHDQFADTYTVDDGQTDPYTITRVSLCEWRGPTSEDPNTIGILRYFGTDPLSIFYTKWVYSLADGGPKSGFQNTPVGEYPNEGGAGFISIS
jgi:hypothetical protein